MSLLVNVIPLYTYLIFKCVCHCKLALSAQKLEVCPCLTSSVQGKHACRCLPPVALTVVDVIYLL